MGKHRRSNGTAIRNITSVAAVAAGASAVLAPAAMAAPVQIPGTDVSIDVPNFDPAVLNSIPEVQQWVPALQNQADVSAVAAQVAAPAPSEGQNIVDIARTKLGAPYAWGATGPNAFDCSGFTTWVYNQVGKSIPRTSQAQASGGMPISYNDLQAGDIVAFYGGASHVGIYSGHGTIIHALNEGTPLSEQPLDYLPFHSAVRY